MLGVVGLIAGVVLSASAVGAGPGDDASIAHLPEVVRGDIEAWRARLAGAKCLEVTCDTDETWASIYKLDGKGSATVALRERYSSRSWMTPNGVWMTVYAYKGDSVDMTRPVYQQYWSAEAKQMWERVWDGEKGEYRAARRACDEPFGPVDVEFGSRGCIYASVMETWLAGGSELSERTTSVHCLALMRKPNLAMVPPDPTQAGVWLDVFTSDFARDQERAKDKLYRRNDFMLLARNKAGEPEVREWRTLVLADETEGGLKPQQITGIRRFAYGFYETEPAEVKAAIEALVKEVDGAVK